MAETFVSGMRQGLADTQSQKAFALTAAQAETTLKQSKATLAAEEKFLELTSGVGSGMAPGGKPGRPPDPDQLAGTMNQLAQAAMKAGQPERARDLAATASTMRSNASLIAQRGTQDQIKKAEFGLGLLRGVTDQKSFDQANALFAMQIGEPSVYAGMEYTPELHAQLEGNLTSALDKAKIKTEDQRVKTAKALEDERRARQPLIKSQIKVNEARAEKLGKETVAKPETVARFQSTINQMLNAQFDVDPAMIKVEAAELAERANEIQRASPGLKASEAAHQAMQEAHADNRFIGWDTKESDLTGTMDEPLDLPTPKSKSPKHMEEWAASMDENKAYNWKGAKWKWDPEKKVLKRLK